MGAPMFNFLKGYRTYLTIIIGLVIVPVTSFLMGFDLSKYVEGYLASKCMIGLECLENAKQIGKASQEMYLAVVGAIIWYFKNLGVKQAKADNQPDAQL